ncbi:hypothetical protein ACFU98_43685 [Streptomyces sp. NPDC057575]|uniref:hypothetical protein n=1 Tax=unclassified Streptomyces TaxID=2593676 RepID=UPI0036957AF8
MSRTRKPVTWYIATPADGIIEMSRKAGTPVNLATAAAAAVTWLAYRCLDALHTADPHLAATVTANVAEQLGDGFSEWAWEAAVDAGYDPQKWLAEAEAEAEAEERAARRALPQPVNA